jgi:hypothetical protein
LAELGDAGTVTGLAHQAMLDYVTNLAAAKGVRLHREALRLGARFGNDAPQVQAAAQRIMLHATFVNALRTEQARAAVPIPATEAAVGIVYGRVLNSNGNPTANCVVEAQTAADNQVLGRSTTDPQGTYLLRLPIKEATVVQLLVRSDKQESPLATAGITIKPATRSYLEIVIQQEQPAPSPPPGPAPEIKMPNLVGLSETAARATLERLGVTHVSVTKISSKAPVGQVVTQAPAPDTQISTDAQVELQVSAESVVVPNLSRMSFEQAIVALNQANLVVGNTEGDQKQGKVTSQKPAAGASVPAGSPVDLQLTSGGNNQPTRTRRGRS